MIIKTRKNGYAHCMYTVEFEDDEASYKDIILITMADRNGAKLSEETKQKILKRPGPYTTGHFGGTVSRWQGGTGATIKVYTD